MPLRPVGSPARGQASLASRTLSFSFLSLPLPPLALETWDARWPTSSPRPSPGPGPLGEAVEGVWLKLHFHLCLTSTYNYLGKRAAQVLEAFQRGDLSTALSYQVGLPPFPLPSAWASASPSSQSLFLLHWSRTASCGVP